MRTARARRGLGRQATPLAEGVPHLVLGVGGEEYALPLLGVREIVRIEGVVPVPKAPPALRGVMSLRGEAIVVVDLAAALGGRSGRDLPESCALIAPADIDGRPTLVGLVVDGVSRVIGLDPDEMAPAPRLGTLLDLEFVAALARVERGFVPVLDLGRLLASEDVRTAASAARAAE